jgi:hypothetical protein
MKMTFNLCGILSQYIYFSTHKHGCPSSQLHVFKPVFHYMSEMCILDVEFRRYRTIFPSL